jgi:hypothetical protein
MIWALLVFGIVTAELPDQNTCLFMRSLSMQTGLSASEVQCVLQQEV